MRKRYSVMELSDAERDGVNIAVLTLEAICRAQLLAIYFQDGKGTFWHLLPGHEREVMGALASIDWQNARRVVEEYIP